MSAESGSAAMHPEPGNSVSVPASAQTPVRQLTEHPAGRSSRAAALRRWLDGELEVQAEAVTLPDSGRRLRVYRPTPAARARLFEQAHADPDKQLPFWADVWPSGIALGDWALRRRDELAGQRVLEIGSGLGVTASAVLEAGAHLLAVDYTPMALTLCRYNSLANSGTAPRALAVNWRELSSQALARLEAAGPFPIIMAGDVLYESRDIDPLIDLISRLLAPDGSLWLSEPGRKVAARFLDTLALRGWRFTSHVTDGPWPSGLDGRVYVHFLRRQVPNGLPYGSIGGWRL